MLAQSDNAKDGQVQATAEQRLAALEGTVAGLSEAVEKLHKMLKEQAELLNEHATRQLAAGNSTASRVGGLSPEDVLYTFVCRRKFDHLEKELGRLRQLLVGPESIRKAS
jgi:TolA-binding protein